MTGVRHDLSVILVVDDDAGTLAATEAELRKR